MANLYTSKQKAPQRSWSTCPVHHGSLSKLFKGFQYGLYFSQCSHKQGDLHISKSKNCNPKMLLLKHIYKMDIIIAGISLTFTQIYNCATSQDGERMKMSARNLAPQSVASSYWHPSCHGPLIICYLFMSLSPTGSLAIYQTFPALPLPAPLIHYTENSE